MPNATFVIQTSSDLQTYFTLRAANNEVILTSELYRAVDNAHQGIESVRKHAPSDTHYVKRESTAGEAYFVLRAANHQVIGTSEMYASKQVRDKGIEAVKAAAPTAIVVDRR
jgi:uncharacterized protein